MNVHPVWNAGNVTNRQHQYTEQIAGDRVDGPVQSSCAGQKMAAGEQQVSAPERPEQGPVMRWPR